MCFLCSENKGADQQLICAFVFVLLQKAGFLMARILSKCVVNVQTMYKVGNCIIFSSFFVVKCDETLNVRESVNK